MPNTLRRKMFKLGGEVNSHGVGLTSGLSYNRPGYNGGGTVAPVGSDVYPKVMGPDGKMREGHNIGMKLLQGILGPTMPYIRSMGRRLPSWLGGDRMRASAGPGIRDYIKYGIRPDRTLGSGPLRELSRAQQARQIANLAFAPSGAILGGAGITQALGERAGLINPPEEDDRVATGILKELGEFAVDVNPLNLASRTGQYLFGDPNKPDKNLYDLLAGRDPASVKVGGDGSQSNVAEGIETQEEEFAALKADAEKRAQLYMDLLGEEPDKMGAISRGLIQAGQLWDEDKGAAVGALGTEAGAETQRIDDLEKQFKGMAVQEVVGGDLAQQQALDQAKLNLISDPSLDPTMRAQGLKQIEAYEAGITDILPLNAKQDGVDPARLSRGNVYLDPTNLYGGSYVGVSSNDEDPEQVKGFNSAEEARAHAAG